ncbi:MAG: DUF4921 family protein [Rubripirellula sp.]
MIDITNPERNGSQKVAEKEVAYQSVASSTAESRMDPISGQWTIFAPGRDQRPEEIIAEGDAVDRNVACPFCAERESETPPPVWVGSLPETPSEWAVRVVPNKYPAVDAVDGAQADPSKASLPKDETGLFQRKAIRGGHEVFIESRTHAQSLSELDLAEVQLLFEAYRDRLRTWRATPGINYLSIFKNVGGKAGASLRHSHSQLIATDQLPASVERSCQGMSRHRLTTGCCLQCDLLRGEMKAKHRIVWHDDSVVAYCPFASRLPMSLRITTLAHQPRFEDLDAAAIASVSRIVKRAVSWLEKLRPGTSYNYCLHTQPPGVDTQTDAFHWSLDLFPRMTQVAGFEWSSDCMINPVLPETAAAKFRLIAKAEDPRSAFRS